MAFCANIDCMRTIRDEDWADAGQWNGMPLCPECARAEARSEAETDDTVDMHYSCLGRLDPPAAVHTPESTLTAEEALDNLLISVLVDEEMPSPEVRRRVWEALYAEVRGS